MTALIAGATGLVGQHLLELLLASTRYSQVISLGRRNVDVQNPKLKQVIGDLSDPEKTLALSKADDVFCCLGTTMAKAGSKEKFYEVDFHYPVALAKATHKTGARQFLIVTALGADKRSPIFYNRVKGEVEEAVRAVGFETVHIFRPSLLLGPRREKRPGEDAAKLLYRIFNFAIPDKYKGISSEKVSNCMLSCAVKEQVGVFIHESRDMQRHG